MCKRLTTLVNKLRTTVNRGYVCKTNTPSKELKKLILRRCDSIILLQIKNKCSSCLKFSQLHEKKKSPRRKKNDYVTGIFRQLFFRRLENFFIFRRLSFEFVSFYWKRYFDVEVFGKAFIRKLPYHWTDLSVVDAVCRYRLPNLLKRYNSTLQIDRVRKE